MDYRESEQIFVYFIMIKLIILIMCHKWRGQKMQMIDDRISITLVSILKIL